MSITHLDSYRSVLTQLARGPDMKGCLAAFETGSNSAETDFVDAVYFVRLSYAINRMYSIILFIYLLFFIVFNFFLSINISIFYYSLYICFIHVFLKFHFYFHMCFCLIAYFIFSHFNCFHYYFLANVIP